MGYFQVRYDSRVVNYDHRVFIRLVTAVQPSFPQRWVKIADDQQNQMVKLFFQPLAIYLQQRKLAQEYKNVKVSSTFCQRLNEFSKIAKDSWNFAKVAKFRQIWSHWTWFESRSWGVGSDTLPTVPQTLFLLFLRFVRSKGCLQWTWT